MKKYFGISLLIIFCTALPQTINIHTIDGNVSRFNLSEIDSITFTLNSNGEDDGLLVGDFGITDSSYTHDSNWDNICDSIFGENYRVADWTDLETYFSDGHDLAALLDGLGLTGYRSNAFVTNDGQQYHTGTRAYFIERHNHEKPAGFSAHAHLDNYLISLGSWELTKAIIVHKK